MPTRHFFLRGQYLCSDTVAFIRVRETLANAHGHAFFCPLCSEVWAAALVDGQATLVHPAFCDKHTHSDPVVGSWSFGHIYSWEVPGSLWISYDAQWNDSLPIEVLAREVLLLTDKMDGITPNYQPQ